MHNEPAIRMFYRNMKGEDNFPTLKEVLAADYNWLEANHDWCQRAYPNFEHSAVVPNAPVLEEDGTLEWLKTFHGEAILMLVFKLVKHYSELSPDRIPHNNRRVTRMIKFLKLVGMNEIAETAFIIFTDSLAIHAMTSHHIHESLDTTHKYWNDALNYEKGDDWTV